MYRAFPLFALTVTLVFASPGRAGEAMKLDELMDSFGWNFDTTEIKTQKLDEGLYVLIGLGGNIAVSIGEQGVLIVDDQFPELIPAIEAAISKLGGSGVDFAINTHWHFDHAQGNLALGPSGTRIVSHANSRKMMTESHIINLVMTQYHQEAYPPEALPVLTFDDRMQMHFNTEQIDLVHTGPAHTTGDAAIIFRDEKGARVAVHMGDVFNNTGYSFIDVDNGGDIDGMIAFCRAILEEIPADAIVIPGHGEVTDLARLSAYIEMLQSVRDRVAKLIASGKSLDEVIAANPAADHEASFGEVSKSLGFLDRVYTSLKKQRP